MRIVFFVSLVLLGIHACVNVVLWSRSSEVGKNIGDQSKVWRKSRQAARPTSAFGGVSGSSSGINMSSASSSIVAPIMPVTC